MKGRARLELPFTWPKRCSRAETELVTADEVLQQGSIEVDPFTSNQYVLVSLRIDRVIVLGFFLGGGGRSLSSLPCALSLPYCFQDVLENDTWKEPGVNGRVQMVWMVTHWCTHKKQTCGSHGALRHCILYTEALCGYFRTSQSIFKF